MVGEGLKQLMTCFCGHGSPFIEQGVAAQLQEA